MLHEINARMLTNCKFVLIFFTPYKLIFYLNATVLFDYLMSFSRKEQLRRFAICLRLSLDSEKWKNDR